LRLTGRALFVLAATLRILRFLGLDPFLFLEPGFLRLQPGLFLRPLNPFLLLGQDLGVRGCRLILGPWLRARGLARLFGGLLLGRALPGRRFLALLRRGFRLLAFLLRRRPQGLLFLFRRLLGLALRALARFLVHGRRGGLGVLRPGNRGQGQCEREGESGFSKGGFHRSGPS
jgi:hypothetical protein